MRQETSPLKAGPQAPIYLDYNATTPLDPEVFEAMRPYFLEHFGNPASGQHAWGWTAQAAVEAARTEVAQLIGADNEEIVFNSGATEGNNTVLFGVYHQCRAENPDLPIHIIVTQVEHSSVLKAALSLRDLGVEVDLAPVDSEGRVSPATIEKLIKPHTRLISALWVNNEVGSINPIREIGELARNHKIYFHTDATQAVGKIPVNLQELPVDLLTFSGHKIYGPKGVGVLFMRAKSPHVTLHPLLCGGGHERGRRSGTLNVPAIVGLGKAAQLERLHGARESERLSRLRERFVSQVLETIPGARLNGPRHDRSPINMSLTFPGHPIDTRLPRLLKLGFSTGSACSAGRTAVSHVLSAIGLNEDDATCTLRLSIGRWTTELELTTTLEILRDAFASN